MHTHAPRRYPDLAGACMDAVGALRPADIPEPEARAALVWVLGLTNICIAGFIEYLEKYEKPPKVAWNATQTAVITLSLAALLVSTLLHLRCGNKRHLEADLRGSGGLLSGEEDEEDNSFAR